MHVGMGRGARGADGGSLWHLLRLHVGVSVSRDTLRVAVAPLVLRRRLLLLRRRLLLLVRRGRILVPLAGAGHLGRRLRRERVSGGARGGIGRCGSRAIGRLRWDVCAAGGSSIVKGSGRPNGRRRLRVTGRVVLQRVLVGRLRISPVRMLLRLLMGVMGIVLAHVLLLRLLLLLLGVLAVGGILGRALGGMRLRQTLRRRLLLLLRGERRLWGAAVAIVRRVQNGAKIHDGVSPGGWGRADG